eukprot:GEMP01064830.1.p1 GENE.GEMP01064830.1~~GEMP01064830.1.p1  ORF type:complete len:245 (+),score=51.59 GEMP01064830.1:168-902(+)
MGAHMVKPMHLTEVRDCWEDVSAQETVSEEEFNEICANVYRRTAPNAYLPDKLVNMWFLELHDHLRVPWVEFYRLYQILVENAGAPLSERPPADEAGSSLPRGHFQDDVGVCDIRHLEGDGDQNYSFAVSRFKKFESPLEVNPDFKRTLNEGKPSEFMQDLKRDLQGIRFSFRGASVDYATTVGDWDHFRDGLTNAVELGDNIARDIEYCHRTYESCDNWDEPNELPDTIDDSQLTAASIMNGR